MKLTVCDFEGTKEELRQLLSIGITIKTIEESEDGKCICVNFVEKKKGGRPPKFDVEKIMDLCRKGKSYGEIATEIGCSKTYVIKVCKNNQNDAPYEVK